MAKRKPKPKTPKRGRPPMPDGSRDAVLRVRIRQDDLGRLQAAARKADRPFPDWVRETLLGAVETRP